MVKSSRLIFLEKPLPSNRYSLHLLLILGLPLLLFWRWVIKGEVLYWGTLLFQFWPWRHLVKSSLLAGEWPLWNPLLGNGTPLLANLQSAVFYPPNLLYLFMPVEQGLTLSVVLHLILAGILMFVYGRHLGLYPFAATVSALTFMFSGYLVGRIQFITMINAAAWIPITLFLYEKNLELSFSTPKSGLNIIALGGALLLPLLAGHGQLWFYTLWLIGSYALFRSWQTGRGHHRPWLTMAREMGKLGLAIGLALLLAGGQLLPTAEFVLHSARSGGAERTFALTYSFWPWRLVTLLAPTFFGHPAHHNYWGYANYWEDHAYLGVLPLILALLAIWPRIRSTVRQTPPPSPVGTGSTYWQVIPFFAGLVPISLILAMGWNTPVYLWIFDYVPGFSFFQAPARLLIWYTVAISVLAGIGAQMYETTSIHRPFWRRLLVAALGLTGAGVAGTFLVSGRSQTFLTATVTFGVWLMLSVILLLLRPDPDETWPARRRLAGWRWIVIILITANLLWAAWPLILTMSPAIFNRPITTAQFLASQPEGYRYYVSEQFDYDIKFDRYYRFDSFGRPEIASWQGLRETLVPNLGIYAGLPSSNNDDPLSVGSWQQLVDLVERSDPAQQAKLLRLMNVGYVIDGPEWNAGENITPPETVAIYHLSNALPRAYFVTNVQWVDSETDALARLSAPDFDSHRELVIMKSGPEIEAVNLVKDTGDSVTAGSPVKLLTQERGRISLSVEALRPGFVVLTDTFYPGWEATVDGQPAHIYQANLSFRAVAVEEGKHAIDFSYQPLTFKLGLWISTISLLLVATTGTILMSIDNSRN